MSTWFELRVDGKCYLPMVYQYSVFDEVEDVVKVGQVSNVDNLSSGGRKKKKKKKTRTLTNCQNRFLISEKCASREFVRTRTARKSKTEEIVLHDKYLNQHLHYTVKVTTKLKS